MKFLDETGLKFIATKIKELRDSLNNKVDKATGKDLSTNDYTNEAKAKVDAIPADPKYTDTVQDLSGYAKKSEIKGILGVDEYDDLLTDNSFENKYLNTKIESKVDWRAEFFPRGVYFFRITNYNGAPERNNDFIVMTSYNATVDIFNESFQMHSRIIEQVAISLNTGKIYERYMDAGTNKYLNIEYGRPSDNSCVVYGIRGRWTNWKEITKDFAMKNDITKAISTLTTFKKEIVTSLPSTGKDNVFYLLKDANGKDNNNYLEYLWINNKWEMVGSTQVDLSEYLKKSNVFDNKTFNGDYEKLKNIPFSAQQGVLLWDRLDRIAPYGELDLSKMVTKISIQDREPVQDSELQGILLSGALDELFLRTTKLNERKANKTEIKTKLSEMTDDATHRLVTDAEKTTWSEKVNNDQLFVKESYEEQKKKYGDEKLIPTVKFIIDRFNGFEKSIRTWAINFITTRLKYYKQQVILTQSEYDALSSTDKNDASKIYFIKE